MGYRHFRKEPICLGNSGLNLVLLSYEFWEIKNIYHKPAKKD